MGVQLKLLYDDYCFGLKTIQQCQKLGEVIADKKITKAEQAELDQVLSAAGFSERGRSRYVKGLERGLAKVEQGRYVSVRSRLARRLDRIEMKLYEISRFELQKLEPRRKEATQMLRKGHQLLKSRAP